MTEWKSIHTLPDEYYWNEEPVCIRTRNVAEAKGCFDSQMDVWIICGGYLQEAPVAMAINHSSVTHWKPAPPT